MSGFDGVTTPPAAGTNAAPTPAPAPDSDVPPDGALKRHQASDSRASQSAKIIPFPARHCASSAVTPEQDRLARALIALNMALAQQRAALQAWRSALDDLTESTASLDNSLRRYRAKLQSLGGGVTALRDAARSLDQWTDNAPVKE